MNETEEERKREGGKKEREGKREREKENHWFIIIEHYMKFNGFNRIDSILLSVGYITIRYNKRTERRKKWINSEIIGF